MDHGQAIWISLSWTTDHGFLQVNNL